MRMTKIVCGIFLSCSALMILTWFLPSLVINDLNINLLRSRIESQGVKWAKHSVEVSRNHAFNKEITLTLDRLEVFVPDLSAKIPSFSVTVVVAPFTDTMINVKNIEILAKLLKLHPQPKETMKFDPLCEFTHLKWEKLQQLVANNISVQIADLIFEERHFKLALGQSIGACGSGMALKVSETKSKNFIDACINLNSEKDRFDVDFEMIFEKLSAKTNLKLKSNWALSLISQGHVNDDQYNLNLESSSPLETEHLLSAKGEYGKYLKIDEAACKTSLQHSFGKIHIAPVCNLNAKIAYHIDPADRHLKKLLPENIDISLNSDIKIKNRESGLELLSENKIGFSSRDPNLVSISGFLKFIANHQKKPKMQDLNNLGMKMHLGIDDLKPIVTALEGTDYQIPAPFNALNGKISCDLAQENAHPLSIRTKCRTRLEAKKQKYYLNSDVLVTPKLDSSCLAHLEGKIELEETKITLPKISLTEEPPNFAVDARIELSEPDPIEPNVQTKRKLKREDQSQKNPTITYQLDVLSKHRKSLCIESNILEKPLFLETKFSLSSGAAPKGKVSISKQSIRFFRKNATIEWMHLDFKENPTDPEIYGRVNFPHNRYKITMDLFGSVTSPAYVLSSKPDLSQDAIISILLFGKEPSELNELDANTVKSTEAAMADRAINMLSMYVLASTPIERVSYNPIDGVFSASVNLAKGTAIELGSDGKKKRIAKLQQVLGENWIFETKSSLEGNSKRRASGVIKWILRY